ESVRDIEAGLRSSPDKLYHMGIRGRVSRSTLADANESHNWRIFADFAQTLIARARVLYAHDPFGAELHLSAYALDSTTIDLCLAMFPWARFRERKGAVKMHTLIDLHGNIPLFVCVTDGKVHDVNILDQITPEAGAFYVMDRGYLDLRAGRHRQEGTQAVRQPLPNPTGYKCHYFRANAHSTAPSATTYRRKIRSIFQPTESVRLIAGHYWQIA